jgi:quinol monooxygenase YgiN
MSELHVVATLPTKPESADLVREALTTLVTATRQEEGCLSYDLYESVSAPGTFVTVERWTGMDELNTHMATPHIAAAIAATSDHLTGDLAVHPLASVS